MSRTCWLWACTCLCIAAAPLSSQRAAFRVAICVVSCSELWALSAETLPWSQTCFESLKRFPISIYFSELKCLRKEVASLAGRHVYRETETDSELGRRDGTTWMWRGDAGEPPTLAEPGTAVSVSKIRSVDWKYWNWVFYKRYYKIWIGILKHLWIGFQQWFSSIFQLLHGHSSGPARAQSNPLASTTLLCSDLTPRHTSLFVRNCESLVSHTKGTVRQSLPVTSQACLGL